MAKGETYEEFVEKFKPKKTTDDCYTPPEIYEAVKNWACKEYGIKLDSIVRPFWPGKDYKCFDYQKGCVVLDNPPFSILTEICEFFLERRIDFFLFAPALTSFSSKKTVMKINHVICDSQITYENGAKVKTSFVTSFRGGDIVAQTAPELTRILNAEEQKKQKKKMPKYSYPPQIITTAMLRQLAGYGIDFKISVKDCTPISTMDAQRGKGKSIFGGGLLLSEKAAAEKAATKKAAEERAAAEKKGYTMWELSDREWEMVRSLGETEAGS